MIEMFLFSTDKIIWKTGMCRRETADSERYLWQFYYEGTISTFTCKYMFFLVIKIFYFPENLKPTLIFPKIIILRQADS